MIMKKLRSVLGSSLAETLFAVMLIGIMGVAMTAGIGMIMNTHEKITRGSNEYVLISTTLVEMKDRIRFSVDYDENSGRFQASDGTWFSFRNPSGEEQGIQIDFFNEKTDTAPVETLPVVPDANGRISGITSSFGGISRSDGVFIIENLHVSRREGEGITVEQSAVACIAKKNESEENEP